MIGDSMMDESDFNDRPVPWAAMIRRNSEYTVAMHQFYIAGIVHHAITVHPPMDDEEVQERVEDKTFMLAGADVVNVVLVARGSPKIEPK